MRLEEFRWRESLKQREAQRAKREAVARWCHFNSAPYHDYVRAAIADRVGGYRELTHIEDKLADWHDSIAECCRRGLVSAPQILRVVHIYTSLDLLDTRPHPT